MPIASRQSECSRPILSFSIPATWICRHLFPGRPRRPSVILPKLKESKLFQHGKGRRPRPFLSRFNSSAQLASKVSSSLSSPWKQRNEDENRQGEEDQTQ